MYVDGVCVHPDKRTTEPSLVPNTLGGAIGLEGKDRNKGLMSTTNRLQLKLIPCLIGITLQSKSFECLYNDVESVLCDYTHTTTISPINSGSEFCVRDVWKVVVHVYVSKNGWFYGVLDQRRTFYGSFSFVGVRIFLDKTKQTEQCRKGVTFPCALPFPVLYLSLCDPLLFTPDPFL